ncbi:RNA polymerase sigma factor [Paenibacillus contaminans]|uniref:RNA polymerase sigma factor n=1 Tax=Paenibacillus contaminans TaxID=450362 RepID=UPI00131462FC|nr:sigma-70 family RNA polymerase sigma factor [Paenibacillus contaminans]
MEECVTQDEKAREKEWISRVLEGHKEDYTYLVNRYKNKIYGLLRGMGADHQDAQDLTQETFLKAYRKLGSHDFTKSLASWLYTIAVNLLRDLRRKAPSMELQADPALHSSPSDDPEEALLLAEHRTELLDQIRKLPTNYQITIMLRYTNDLSYEEISEVLEVPQNKIQNDLYRAKRRLKQLMTAEEVKTDAML